MCLTTAALKGRRPVQDVMLMTLRWCVSAQMHCTVQYCIALKCNAMLLISLYRISFNYVLSFGPDVARGILLVTIRCSWRWPIINIVLQIST